MKRLILVRHGKSSWKDEDLPDRKRPLKKRGHTDGTLIVEAFAKQIQNPEKIWTSDAVRAHTTATIFKDILDIKDNNFLVKPDLYTFDDRKLLHIIKGCEDDIDSLMVFGHNNAMTYLVNKLGDKQVDNVPTTGLTIIDFDVLRWTQIKEGKAILTLFPKNLK